MDRGPHLRFLFPWATVAVLGAILFAIAAGTQEGRRVFSQGFRNLAWGTSTQQATEQYPDLAFVRFEVPEGGQILYRVYERGKDDRNLFGVAFDNVWYWFRDDRLQKISATKDARVGPRTIVSTADSGFDLLLSTLTERFGAPDEAARGPLTPRRATWSADEVRIAISEALPRRNVETLSLEIARKPK